MGDVAIRAENNAADVELFAGAVDRFVGRDVRQIAFGAARIADDWFGLDRLSLDWTTRLAAKNQIGGNEGSCDSHARSLALPSDGFHKYPSRLEARRSNPPVLISDNSSRRPVIRPPRRFFDR